VLPLSTPIKHSNNYGIQVNVKVVKLQDDNGNDALEKAWLQLLSVVIIDSRGALFDVIANIKWVRLMLMPLPDLYTAFSFTVFIYFANHEIPCCC